jgi:hypothetical protein
MTATERQQRWRKKKRIERLRTKPKFDWDTKFALASTLKSVRLARQLLRRRRPDAEHIDMVLATTEATLEGLGVKM